MSIQHKHRSLVIYGAKHDAERCASGACLGRGSNCQRMRLDVQMMYRPGTDNGLLSHTLLLGATQVARAAGRVVVAGKSHRDEA